MSAYRTQWIEALVEFLESDGAAEWLSSPHSRLENRTPLEAVGDGDQDRVADLVEKLVESGDGD